MNFTTTGRHRNFVRTALLAGVAGLALPGVASAQDAMEDAAQAQPSTGEDRVELDEKTDPNVIVITATKREQTLQEVPVAVSVTTADTIEQAQIRDVTDLATVVPSLKVSQNQSQFATSYSIRGFGTDGNNLGLEPSVAMFVDGVYRSRAVAQISDLPNIQRVEVLRGPQSTLFGKNASAGVISIVTSEPSFDFGGSVEAAYGNYNSRVAKAYVTGGLTETIAASIAAGFNKRDGYLYNPFLDEDVNNRNRWFVRGQMLFEPSDAFKFRLIGDYDNINELCCGVVNLRQSAATQAVRAVGGMVNDANDPFADIIYSDVSPTSKVKNWGVSGQADYDFGNVALTSITAYRTTKLDANQDVDFTSAALAVGANVGNAELKTFTQELRLASNFAGPFNFLIGGYYFNENVDESDQIVYGNQFRPYANLLIQGATGGTQTVNSLEATLSALNQQNYTGQFFAAGQGFFNNMVQKDRSYSVFGQFDYEVTDRLTLTFGGNYTKDKKRVTTNSFSTDVFSGIDLTQSGQTAIYLTGLSQQVGSALGLGRPATQAEIQFFATNPTTAPFFPQIQAGVAQFAAANATNPAVNPLLTLRPLQFLPPFQNCPNAVEACRTNDGNFSYTLRAAYEITPTLNGYISYATGFKASSFNLSRDARPTPADYALLVQQGLAVTNLTPGSRFAAPEKSRVYEIGLKGNWDYASAILTVFQQSISNFQTNTFTGTGFIFANADKQSTTGVEFEGNVRPTDQLVLSLALTYLDPKYDSFVNSPLGDLSGTTIVTIPKVSSVFGAQYTQPVGNDTLVLNASFNYASPVQVVAGLPGFITRNPDGSRNYETARAAARPFRTEVNDLNASITYGFDWGLSLSVYGRNLLDDRNITTIFDSVAQAGSISGYVNQPRTYGVAAKFTF